MRVGWRRESQLNHINSFAYVDQAKALKIEQILLIGLETLKLVSTESTEKTRN